MPTLDLLLFFVIPSSLAVLGLLVYFNNSKSLTNRLFLLITLTSAASALGSLGSRLTTSPANIFLWVKFTMVFASMVTPLMAFFVIIFPKDKFSFNKILLFADFCLVGILVYASIFDLLFVGVKYVNGEVLTDPGPLIVLFLISQIIHVFIIAFVLIKRLFSTSGREREGFKYLTLGFVMTLIFISIFNVFMVIILKNTKFVSLGMFSFVILEGSIFYAITKHRLMDIRLVVARAVSYVILVLILAFFYVIGMLIMGVVVLKQQGNASNLASSTVLTLIIALSFQPLLKSIEKITDRFFYKVTYDANTLLSLLSHIMSTNIEIRPLVNQTLQAILKEMRITKGALILKSEGDLYQVISEGFEDKLDALNCRFTFSLDMHKIVIFDDLEEGELKESMRSIGVSLAKVLHINDDIIGFLILGEKASGEMYSDQDLKVFDILSPELSVAIQNAQSYDKIKRFNITLEEEVKKATIDLQKANSRLKELDRLKNDFVSIASHELRTPMTAIRSYLWMALKRPDTQLTFKMEKYLSRAYISTERLINLVNDMLNVSRIESGSIEIKPKEFDIQTLSDEIISMVLPKAGEKNIKVDVVKGQIPSVFADPDKVTQVILNLLGNALKFTPVDGTVSVKFFTDGKVVETSIHDSGVGISREDLPKLFQKFGRLDSSYAAAATSGGTGLGLFISKSLIDLMHGKIWATSEGNGKGATFTFSLPVLTPDVLANAEHYTKKPVGEAKELQKAII
ncbi:MAG: ATP-binding protein [Candidatus Daviesbacteria bacterium]|nr:ATP-binding protein [Candidatus Daviesbacteria bacterium]